MSDTAAEIHEEASRAMNPEQHRVAGDGPEGPWKLWGPYLSERQWGTVREDYSADGDCWRFFPHDHARSRAYRWGEDGLLGLADRQCRLCFALTLWNERDPILKERLFGLANPDGNHGEDVKELYYYLDATPTASYLKALYKYPLTEFPYAELARCNRQRGFHDPEFEITDTGAFREGRYADVLVEYAKASPTDVLIRISVTNRGPEPAVLHVLPTLWFRNTWSWGGGYEADAGVPALSCASDGVWADHATLGRYRLDAAKHPDWLFTNNETNATRLFDSANEAPFVKDAFHDYLIGGDRRAVNPDGHGTKTAAHYRLELAPGEVATLDLRLRSSGEVDAAAFGTGFDEVLTARRAEAEAFYRDLAPNLDEAPAQVHRQASAGLIWSRQFYYYDVRQWIRGDPAEPPPPAGRQHPNFDWPHVFVRDVLSMPDKWEFPWFAVWDSAFHMFPYADLDPAWAKDQLLCFLQERYQHPNGQLPAYEFNFGDVNPPVHAWACRRVYQRTGRTDRVFLARAFQKLTLNFTWWVNRKDVNGNHLFAGGFLGLDNIGVFDRSKPLPSGGPREQADGTAWMAFFCAEMLVMALELAREDPAYEDMASKFLEHYVTITDAINTLDGTGLWDERDGFYYDHLHVEERMVPLRVRSMVGLIPLFAVELLSRDVLERLPAFRRRLGWFVRNRLDVMGHLDLPADGEALDRPHYLLTLPSRRRLERMLRYVFDETEFLSPFGVRSLSKAHAAHPFVFHAGEAEHRVEYVPGESDNGLFGGNSNWRGPVWFPVNFLLIEALREYHTYYGDTFRVECPTGSGHWLTLGEAADEIAARLARLFLPDAKGHRPCHGEVESYASDPHWQDLVLFYEYFHGDTGRGCGASHQTGWTALVASLLRDISRSGRSLL